MNRRSFLVATVGFVGAAGLPAGARAARLAGVQFEDVLELPTGRLRLLGSGLYYYRLLVKVAATALYLDDRTDSSNVLGDVAKRLEMQYFWGVKATDLVAGATAMLALNLSPARYAALKAKIDQFHEFYQDVAAGDRCVIEYQPSVGTTLSINGKKRGTVPGCEFAAAYFSIWLGERPIDDELKRKLLGK